MAPASAERATRTSGRHTSTAAVQMSYPSPSPVMTNSSLLEGPPPAKKPKISLKLKGPKAPPPPIEVEEDSIAVASTRTTQRARKPSAAWQESQNLDVELPPPSKSDKRAPSPAPSSGLSSLLSAPPSSAGDDAGDDNESREESPFQDEPVSTLDDYGEHFASFYIAGGDEPEVEKRPKDAKPKPSKADAKRKRVSAPYKPSPKADTEAKAERVKKSTKSSVPRRSSSSAKATAVSSVPAQNIPQHPPNMPQAQNLPPPHMIQGPPVHMQQPQMPRPGPVLHHGPAPYPQGPMPHQGPHPPAGPPRPPAPPVTAPPPVIRFIEVAMDPKPPQPDTIRVVIEKLTSLSETLKQFGGVPAVAVTPSPATRTLSMPKEKPKKKPKPVARPPANANQLDSFLDMFDDDDDSDDSRDTPASDHIEQPEVKDLNYQLPATGVPDTPLGHGISFIQNALKSWAQQRMTHTIMTQWNDEQARAGGHFQPQGANGRRPQGRSKKIDLPLGGPPPVIEMNLSLTPEGLAIKKFQSVLDSGCLQANIVLPIELGRALRHLYMQIDSLINQGQTNDRGNWYCMSYGAQIAAHQARLNQWKDTEARRLQEANMMQQQQHQQQYSMAQMGLNPSTTPMTQEDAQRYHAVELERRRSAQHAQQQPYNSQRHLNPLELGSQRPPTQNGSSLSPVPVGNGPPGTPGTPDGVSYDDCHGVSHRNNFEKVKMYMPGYLPRSGQNMKFSFAPNSADAVRVFGHEAFPSQAPLGPQMPNRGPMMDVPRPQSSTPAFQTPIGDTPMPDAVRSPSISNTAEDAIDLTASDGPQPEQVNKRPKSRPSTSKGVVGGFQAINKLPPSPTQPVQDTIEVNVSRPTPVARVIVKRQNRTTKHYPHPGSAIIVDD